MRFERLLDESAPSSRSSGLKARLREELEAAGLLLHDGDTAREPDRLVLGVAEYVSEDLRLLDRIVDVASTRGIPVRVFLLTDCTSQDDIARLIPGIGPVFNPPVVGIWRGGELTIHASGHAARRIVDGLAAGRS